jgi:branched-chain amino acid transport system substrate-binding protein
MKKHIPSVLMLAVLVIVQCEFTFSSVSAQQNPSYRLGVNLDITGYAAWLGEPQLQAVQLFAEQVNAKGGLGGHPLELVIYDNESNPEKSANIAKKLIQRDKVMAMIATSITATSNAARPIAQDERIVMYSLSASFEPNYQDSFAFAIYVPTNGQVGAIFDYFVARGIRRVAILCATDSTGQTWFEETTKAAKKVGFEIAVERFNVKDMDVTPQLAKLRAINPQALIAGASGQTNAVVVKNFNQMGFKIPYVTGAGSISVAFLKLLEGNEPDTLLLSGAYCVVWRELPDSFPQKKLMQEFNEAFQKKYRKEIDIYSVGAYDAIRILAEAIRQVKPEGPQDSVKLRDAIEKIIDFPAVYGKTYSFSKENHRGVGKDSAVMVQAKDGKFVMAK